MPSCEKCWSDSRAEAHWSGGDPVCIYRRLVSERDCTPEEQAGPEATQCDGCGKQTVHQYARICMTCGWEPGQCGACRRTDCDGHPDPGQEGE